jgi:endonuclease/exonuclease/phosphatase family metal-dependent hydrolase
LPLSLITWNIQWGRGCDGRVDLQRIIRTARAMADFDVLCVQEVARNFPGLPGSNGGDQFRLLAELMPGCAAIEVPAPTYARRTADAASLAT